MRYNLVLFPYPLRHFILAKRVNLVPVNVIDSLLIECESVGKLLSALIRSLEKNS